MRLGLAVILGEGRGVDTNNSAFPSRLASPEAFLNG